MLRVTWSNRLEALAERLVAELDVPAGDVLTPDVVVVQNAGMGRWVQLRLATAHGLCANVRFPFPAAYVWQLFDRVLGPEPDGTAFEPAVTTWRIMELLAHLEPTPRFTELAAYLAGDGTSPSDDRRRYELARRIADVFDQYLVYRPDWIRRWEAGGADDWQAALWRRIVRGTTAHHRVHRLDAFLAAFDGGRIPAERLPPRVSVFGISSMPPAWLEVFARLGERAEVHLYVVNPCRQQWSYIVSEADLARRTARVDSADQHLEVGHPLLASLGKQGREFIDLVSERVGGQVDELFEEPDATTLLGHLQADILALRYRPDAKRAAAWDDRTIQLHSCHGALREIEVLHDQLLALFDADPTLRPADVVVMTPDIEAYAPAIDAVFGTAPADRRIPFSVADRNLGAASPVVRAFLDLLDLAGSRYEASRLLALLEVESVRRRFGFTEADLTLARAWVRASGIRWGVDAEARAELALPAMAEHTWRFGLERLLLGYARRGDDHALIGGILPFDDVEGTQARAVGLLVTFAEAAFALRTELAAPRSPGAWAAALAGVVDRFFAPSDVEEPAAHAIRRSLARLADAARDAGAETPVSLGVVDAHLRRELAEPASSGSFLAGRVTFCAMVPMRSIPFAVVCLVGMNDGSFPRAHRPLGFDLMGAEFRPGDRSRRDDDRWLFLEAILSARRTLYVSYVGHDIRDNRERPPSPLVAELLDVLARGYGVEDLVVHHPLQPFSRRYFMGDSRLVSYADDLAAASRVAERTRTRSVPLLTDRLPPAGDEWRAVSIETLVRFFRNPARFLLQERLGIRLEESEGLIESREPLVLDRLEAYHLRNTLLAIVQAGRPLADALAVARAAGLVPHGQVGERVLHAEAADVATIASRLETLAQGERVAPVAVEVTIEGVRLRGTLDQVTRAGRVEFRPANMKAGDWTTLWIRHLVLDCVAPSEVERRSWFVARDQELALGPIVDARGALGHLVRHFMDGLHRPLSFLPRSAFAAIRAASDPLGKARREWRGTDQRPGECEDPYLSLAFRGTDPIGSEFLALVEDILGPIRDADESNA
jgi:exodeoxyribonuclease V gamma subunit